MISTTKRKKRKEQNHEERWKCVPRSRRAFVGSKPVLTKREYYTIMAMQGLLAGGRAIDDGSRLWIVRTAVELADGLIEQLEK